MPGLSHPLTLASNKLSNDFHPHASSVRRLARSQHTRIIGGLCGGLADYFGFHPAAFRFVWALTGLLGGVGILAYFLAVAIVPAEPPAKEEASNRDWVHPASGVLFLLIAGAIWTQHWRPLPEWFFHPFQSNPWPYVIAVAGLFIIVIRPHRSRPMDEPLPHSTISAGVGPVVLTGAHAAYTTTPGPLKLMRSRNERVVFGICGGLAQKWGTDPSIVRFGWTFGALASQGVLGIVYLVMRFTVKEEPERLVAQRQAPHPQPAQAQRPVQAQQTIQRPAQQTAPRPVQQQPVPRPAPPQQAPEPHFRSTAPPPPSDPRNPYGGAPR